MELVKIIKVEKNEFYGRNPKEIPLLNGFNQPTHYNVHFAIINPTLLCGIDNECEVQRRHIDVCIGTQIRRKRERSVITTTKEEAISAVIKIETDSWIRNITEKHLLLLGRTNHLNTLEFRNEWGGDRHNIPIFKIPSPEFNGYRNSYTQV
jgi:hypothetical protein